MIMVKKATEKSLKSLEQKASGQKKQQTMPQKNRKRLSGFVLSLFFVAGILFVLLFGWVSGILPWSLKYVECGKPPTTIEQADYWSGSSSGTPQEPGDKGYGPGFGKSYVCTSIEDMYPDNTPRL